MVLLDSTVVNVALPAITDDLGGGLSGQQWVVNAYLLFLASLILVGGSLGDLYGEKRVFMIGVAGFGAVSAVCAAAPSIEVLVAGRALQGIFGALLTPASLAIIVAAFSEQERGKAIGTWTAYSGMAMIVGPTFGGWIVDTLDWRLIFAINVPFVLGTLAIATRMPGPVEGRAHARPDVLGSVLCAIGLAGPTFGLVRQPDLGWGDPQVLVPIVGGVLVFAAFLAYERRAREPMLPLGLFRRGNFAWGNVETLAMYGGLGVMFFLLTLFLIQVGDYSALKAGSAALPVTAVMFLFSRRFGALADRYGPRLFMAFGPMVSAAGTLLLLLMIDEEPAYWTEVFPGIVVFGLGLTATVSPLTAAILADAEEQNAGIASGVNNAVARVASLLATAAIGAVIGGTLDLDGFRMGLAFSTGLLVLGGLIGLFFIRNAPRREVRSVDCAGGQLAGAPNDGLATAPAGAAAAAAATGPGR
ncbi:MAG: Uncharacterized MFS-type transporter [uncultured Solirubrobacteraceae bacterium]|uniref:Uncharacterized MFS-type transporter n=1 Tax=uncultured Solirubrobacteraceae bacterium TaxID=1162706 RepID=A0A6J4RIH4_9ACTN|nr:MAG: Uncharacterized MFS-type transporter [uncultured Solirubrobacteraceae bacterium]